MEPLRAESTASLSSIQLRLSNGALQLSSTATVSRQSPIYLVAFGCKINA